MMGLPANDKEIDMTDTKLYGSEGPGMQDQTSFKPGDKVAIAETAPFGAGTGVVVELAAGMPRVVRDDGQHGPFDFVAYYDAELQEA